jgi:hypothetical protein
VTEELPWDECSACEYNQTMKPGNDDVLRFVEHMRKRFHKGKLITVPCEGSFRTFDEAWEIRKAQPPGDPSQRPR